jgi:queuine/archaeosine tRNA-ribosyltransferase
MEKIRRAIDEGRYAEFEKEFLKKYTSEEAQA